MLTNRFSICLACLTAISSSNANEQPIAVMADDTVITGLVEFLPKPEKGANAHSIASDLAYVQQLEMAPTVKASIGAACRALGPLA